MKSKVVNSARPHIYTDVDECVTLLSSSNTYVVITYPVVYVHTRQDNLTADQLVRLSSLKSFKKLYVTATGLISLEFSR